MSYQNATKDSVGLGNCDNTSDVNKPVSTAQATSIATKATIATTLAGYGITNAYPLSGNPSAFLTIVPVGYTGWVKITKSYTDFSTAGLSNTITLNTLAAKSVVSAVVMNPSTAFTGGLISAYTISVGMATAIDLMPASSTFTTSARPFSSNLIMAGSVGTTQIVTVTATSVTGLLNAATQGSVDIWILTSTLP